MKRFLKHIFFLMFILTAVTVNAQTRKTDANHKVEKGETIYGITHKYGITIDELKEANPEMLDPGFGLKTGEIIIIPAKKGNNVSGKSNIQKTVSIGVLLPLNKKDRDGINMTEYYRGMLMACKYLKREGYNISVHAWDANKNADIDAILKEKGAANCDVIFGPFYSHQVQKLSKFAKEHDIRLAIPFASAGSDMQNNKNIFILNEFNPVFEDSACERFISLFKKVNPVIIDCNDSKEGKGSFTSAMRKALDNKNIKYSITNLNSDNDKFAKAFKKNRKNIVILNSSSQSSFHKASDKINVVRNTYPDADISILGYNEWFVLEQFNLNSFAKNDVYIPSFYYYNTHSAATKRIEADYYRWFGTKMLQVFPKYAISGYDHASFFIRGIAKYGKKFNGSKDQGITGWIQSPLQFKSVSLNGGYQNTAFMFIHYKKDNSIEHIAY